MTEKVIIRQNSRFETEFRATDPEKEESREFFDVSDLHELTPYGMLLSSLGGCTAIVVNTYANHHEIPLQAVEIRLEYKRNFKEDCVNCETIERYEDIIEEQIRFEGRLNPEQLEKLEEISHKCSIHRLLEDGVEIRSQLVKNK